MNLAPIAVTAIIAGLGSANADAPGADWISKEQVNKILQDEGYTDIRKLEADDGHWEGDATKDGRWVEIHLDLRNGAVTKSEADP